MAHLNLGLLLGRVGRVAEAKIVLRVCAGLDNTGLRDPRTHRTATVACLFHLGRLAMEQGRLHEAVDVFFEAVNKRPDFYPPQVNFTFIWDIVRSRLVGCPLLLSLAYLTTLCQIFTKLFSPEF